MVAGSGAEQGATAEVNLMADPRASQCWGRGLETQEEHQEQERLNCKHRVKKWKEQHVWSSTGNSVKLLWCHYTMGLAA